MASDRNNSKHLKNPEKGIQMQNKILAAIVASAALLPLATHAEGDGPWMVRARAVGLNFANGQTDNLSKTAKVEADNRVIPEVDITYFINKNIAAELVLTYPQNIDIKIDGVRQGTVRALPPSLLLQYHFTDFGALKPYVGAGVNYTVFTQRDNILNGVASVDRSSTGLVAQVGIDYAISKTLSLNLDVKYIQMSTDVSVAGAKVGKVNLNPMLYGIGIGYRF
jgi:outer membrane protein